MTKVHFFRCAKHANIPMNNRAAKADSELDTLNAECGACIMFQVWWIRHQQLLPVLETLADLFRHHAQLKERISQLEGQLVFLRGPSRQDS